MTKYLNHFSILAILLIGVGFANAQSNPHKNAIKFGEVIGYISQMYVDSVNDTEITEKAIVNMLSELDPHSSYIPPDDVDDANERINGSFVGIGIRFQILKDTLLVVQPISNGPSEKVGLLPGDKIIEIEDVLVAGVGLKNSQVREKLLGEKGTKVRVKIQRNGSDKLLDFTITRDKIPVYSVDASYMVTPTTGYIKLNSFSRTSLDEVRTGIIALKKEGMENLILDLQGNGGGLLYAAQKIADEFLSDDKLVVYSEGRAQSRQELRSGDKGHWEKGKLVLLTDEYSASASEIVSGAIQDWDRGLIVGRRTFGKGLVQRPINLSDGSQIRLTIARYYTPGGRFIQKPYDDNENYRSDILDRYKNGEFSNADSIKFPDSLKMSTLLTKRTVYSGGGIMPDIFVPLDTTGNNLLYRALSRSGVFNTFALNYVNKNRSKLEKEYKTFDEFKSQFSCEGKILDEFYEEFISENPEFEYTEEDMIEASALIQTRLKATFARDLWGTSEFYQIYNDNNEILLKAIQVMEEGEYNTIKLAANF
ncbi:MAG: carboxyl-terminal processing protease [Lentimonas sp.]|jgi:carboxyl-terminal processing protease